MIHELFAYLCVDDADRAIRFYQGAFGATEKFRLTEPGGRIGHAELDFDGATLMLCEEFPEYNIPSPKMLGGTAVTIHLHVDNADETIERAIGHGAALEMAPQDMFYGERAGVVRDPFGHRWNIGHNIEDITPDEMQQRYTRMMQQT